MNEQFISRNQNEMLQVFLQYRELLNVKSHYVMYMDAESWELFDPNVGRTIIRHDFKHLKSMIEDLYKLRYDLGNVGAKLFGSANNHIRREKQSETWSYKALLKLYSETEINRMYGID